MSEKSSKKGFSRRSFISKSAAASFGAILGSKMVFADNFPNELQPVGLHAGEEFILEGKHKDLVILNNKPVNAETPAHLLDPKVTPTDVHFVRNNGIPPKEFDLDKWTLTIDGESVTKPKTYSLQDLKTKFKQYTYQLTIECGGNGRKEFNPPAKGNQWDVGAVGCSKWTGIRLKDVLNDVGLKSDAVYIGYYGADTHISGDPKKVVISRGLPMKKAMEDETLIAWQMNGKDIPVLNGYPLRLAVGGWPASTSGKWLNRISVRNKVHDGPKMEGTSYRVPKYPVAPGQKVPDEDMKIIEAMPVKSLITYPKTGAMVKGNQTFEVRGHAWAGDKKVKEVHVSIDFGATWQKANLTEAANKNAWQHFSKHISLPEEGYFEVWSRAIDEDGKSQPMVIPGWNPKGYLNNACHRIAIKRV